MTKLSKKAQRIEIAFRENWTEYLYFLAGCEYVETDDDDIEDGGLYPNGGDWVVKDLRSNSGTYGYCHETLEISEVTLVNPKNHNVNYDLKTIERTVDTVTLLKRYYWISHLFQWSEEDALIFPETWDDEGGLDVVYAAEKKTFKDDPYLALYWLIHFGFCMDTRYDEVKSIVKEHDLEQELDWLGNAIAFFDEIPDDYDINIPNHFAEMKRAYNGGGGNEKLYMTGLFTKRRAIVVWYAQVIMSKSMDFPLRWKGVAIYPQKEPMLLHRVYSIVGDIQKLEEDKRAGFYNKVEKWIKSEEDRYDDIIYAFITTWNPDTEQKTKDLYANQVIKSLGKGKETYQKELPIDVARTMLAAVSKHSIDLDLFTKVCKSYFKHDKESENYEVISKVIGKDDDADEVQAATTELNALIELKEKKQLKGIKKILKGRNATVLAKIAESIGDTRLSEKIFVYLLDKRKIEDREKAIKEAFINGNFNSYSKIPDDIIKKDKDPNIDILIDLLDVDLGEPTSEDYGLFVNNPTEDAQIFILTYFVKHIQFPKVYDFLMDTLLDEKYSIKAKDDIFNALRNDESWAVINSTSKERVEKLLDAACHYISVYGPDGANLHGADAMLCRMGNPLSKEWATAHYDDEKWLNTFDFENMSFFGTVQKTVKGRLQCILENTTKKEIDGYVQGGAAMLTSKNYYEAFNYFNYALSICKPEYKLTYHELYSNYGVAYSLYFGMEMYENWQTDEVAVQFITAARKVVNELAPDGEQKLEEQAGEFQEETMRYISNLFGAFALKSSDDPETFEEAVGYLKRAIPYIKNETHFYIYETLVKLLLALNQNEEGYQIVSDVLEMAPDFKAFQGIKNDDQYQKWKK